MLVALLLIPINIIILNIWLWLYDNIFWLGEKKTQLMIASIILWVISWGAVLLYPKLAIRMWYTSFDFTQPDNIISLGIFVAFFLYSIWVVLISKLVSLYFKLSFTFIVSCLTFATIFFLGGIIFLKLWIEATIVYYLFVAVGEEFLKFSLWLQLSEKWKLGDNDILIFCILAALGFAFVENLVYVIWWISGQSLGIALVAWGWILVSRWVIGFLVHALFTWIIAFFIRQSYWWSSTIFRLAAWILLWVGLHYLYNLLLFSQFKFTIVIAIFFGYFALSYLFYNSDRLYFKLAQNS